MKITLSMKVDDVLETFENEFDLVLKINKAYGSDSTLLDIATTESKNISLNVTKDTKVSALESMFLNHFGIQVQAKNMNMGSINPDVRLGDIRDLYIGKLIDDDIITTTGDRAEQEIKTASSKETEIKIACGTDSKNQYTTIAQSNDHIEELISKIDKSYMSFQEGEKYKTMLSLLSVMESALLTFPNNAKLNKHIIDIKTKGYLISNVSIKKKKITLIVFSVISFIILAIGISILCFDIYNHMRSVAKIESISREINNLNSSKRKALESKNNEEADAIDKMIEDNNQKASNIENSLNRNKINLFLIAGIICLIIISVLVVKLEKYSITASRFYK